MDDDAIIVGTLEDAIAKIIREDATGASAKAHLASEFENGAMIGLYRVMRDHGIKHHDRWLAHLLGIRRGKAQRMVYSLDGALTVHAIAEAAIACGYVPRITFEKCDDMRAEALRALEGDRA